MTIFKTLLANTEFTNACPLFEKQLSPSVGDSLSGSLKPITAPDRLWVLATADAYRELSVSGDDLDLALSYMLARAERPTEELATYSGLLQSPGLIHSIIGTLYPRPGVAISVPQKYAILEASVVSSVTLTAVKGIRDNATIGDPAVKAYTAVVINMLVSLGLCAPPEQAYVVVSQKERLASIDTLRAYVLQGKIRDSLVSKTVASVKAKLPDGFSPQMLAERAAAVFRNMAEFLDAIKLMSRRFDTVEAVLNAYFTRKDDLSLEISLMDEVRDFANHANFLHAMVTKGLRPRNMSTLPVAEIREAFASTRMAIAATTDLKEMPLSEYADRFGMSMTYSPGGVRRGAVVYTLPSVSASMPLVKGTTSPAGTRLRPIPQEYAMSQGLASSVTKGLLSDIAMESLVSMVSDELARSQDPSTQSTGLPTFTPILRGVCVSEADLLLLAMARADTINYRKVTDESDESGAMVGDSLVRLELIFGVPLAPAWRTEVLAATPKYGFFSDPAAVVVYTAPEEEYSPKPWPSGPQTLKLTHNAEKLFQVLPNPDETLRTKVADPFDLKLPYVDVNGNTAFLALRVQSIYPTVPLPAGFKDVFIAAVLEPATAKAISSRVAMALAYTKSSDPSLASRARTWLVTSIMPILVTPVMTQITWETMNTALIEAKLDGRALQSQMAELHVSAAFGCALAILQRYGLLNMGRDIVTQVVEAVPPANMSPIASVLRAQLADSASRVPTI